MLIMTLLCLSRSTDLANAPCQKESNNLSPFAPKTTDIEAYFDSVTTGPGVWKWRHYFNIYERHFARFRGRNVRVLEIGIFSGGSLAMWRWFFGEKAHIYGVDLSNQTLVYHGNAKYGSPEIFIGDQTDPKFWAKFKAQVPELDVVIEDGGHDPKQQQAALEALWPMISMGGVYLTEDVHGGNNAFAAYVFNKFVNSPSHGMMALQARMRNHQEKTEYVAATTFYHGAVVLDKQPCREFHEQLQMPRHGSEWKPIANGVIVDH